MTNWDLETAFGNVDLKYVKSIRVFERKLPSWRCIMKKSVKFAVTASAVLLTVGVLMLAMLLQNDSRPSGPPAGNGVVPTADIRMEKPKVEDPRPISCQEEADGAPVVILTEKRFEAGAKKLEQCYDLLKESGSPSLRFQFLPEDPTARAAKIESLKTEIMAGKGPDAFLLNSDITLDTSFTPFFDDVQSAMRFNLFLPLNDLINESDIIHMSSLNTTVFDAGKVGNVQYLMPILYNFGITVVNADDLTANALPSSWQEVLDCEDKNLRTAMMHPASLFPGNTFSSLADYDTGRLTISQEQLQKRFQEIAADYSYNFSEGCERVANTSQLGVPFLLELEASQVKNRAFLPLPNENGGITANVTAFAAVNANAKHPRAAFAALETLFREELLTHDGITRTDYSGASPHTVYYGPTFYSVSMMTLANGISVMDRAFLDSDSVHLSQEDKDALKQCFDQIDQAHITSQLDNELYRALPQILHGDASLEETAAQTYAALQMMLAES